MNNSTFQFDLSQNFSFFLAEISKQAKWFQLSVFALAKETEWPFSRHHSRRHKRRWRFTCCPVVKMLVLGVSDKTEVAPFAKIGVTCALLCWDNWGGWSREEKGFLMPFQCCSVALFIKKISLCFSPVLASVLVIWIFTNYQRQLSFGNGCQGDGNVMKQQRWRKSHLTVTTRSLVWFADPPRGKKKGVGWACTSVSCQHWAPC